MFHVEMTAQHQVTNTWEYVAKFSNQARAEIFTRGYANEPGNEGYLFRVVERGEGDDIAF